MGFGRGQLIGLLPGNLVCARHGDQLLPQQDAVPCLDCAGPPYGDRPFPRLNLGAQVPSEFPDEVFAAVHWEGRGGDET